MKLMVYVLLAAVLGLSVAQGYQVERLARAQTQVAQTRIEARQNDLHAWHTVVCSIEAASIASASVSADKKPAILKFYDNLLISIQAQPCGLKIPK
jgi:hypothetical protein